MSKNNTTVNWSAKKTLYLLIIFTSFLLTDTLFAMPSDTLTKPDLTYHSVFEKNNFDSYIIDKQFDTLGFLLAIDSIETKTDAKTVQNELQSFYRSIDVEGNKKKKNLKKYIDFLFINIHDHFLRKYEENVAFNQIFKKGIYNCVTASALYALVFDHYGIRYAIKELPTHVYLVVDPEALSIQIETTDPKGGYFAPSDKFKKNFLNQLLAAKLVTQKDVSTMSGQKLFEKFYYDNNNANVSFPQLVALLYFNKAIALSELEQYKSAFFESEKAYFLYPSSRIKYVLAYSIYAEVERKQKLNQNQMNDIEVVKLATKIFPYVDFSSQKRKILSNFQDLSQELLIKKNKVEYYEEVYSVLESSIKDSITLSEMRFIYFSTKAQEAYLKAKYKLSVDYTVKCLAINPEDLQMKSNLTLCIMRSFGNSHDYVKILTDLEVFESKYAFLSDNEMFIKAKSIALMSIAGEKCYDDKYSESLKYFEQFEQLMSIHPMTFEDDAAGGAYGEASSYCVRKLIDYKKARDWLDRGFKYEPNSPILKRKLNVLNDNPMPSKSQISTEEINMKEVKLSNPPKPKKPKN
jgi:tetratricopeptide (TPR) repeat protein